MNKCDICGKKLKKNSYVASLSLDYCFYDGQCYCYGGKYNEDCPNYDIVNVCSGCGDRIKGFIESLRKEAKR